MRKTVEIKGWGQGRDLLGFEKKRDHSYGKKGMDELTTL